MLPGWHASISRLQRQLDAVLETAGSGGGSGSESGDDSDDGEHEQVHSDERDAHDGLVSADATKQRQRNDSLGDDRPARSGRVTPPTTTDGNAEIQTIHHKDEEEEAEAKAEAKAEGAGASGERGHTVAEAASDANANAMGRVEESGGRSGDTDVSTATSNNATPKNGPGTTTSNVDVDVDVAGTTPAAGSDSHVDAQIGVGGGGKGDDGTTESADGATSASVSPATRARRQSLLFGDDEKKLQAHEKDAFGNELSPWLQKRKEFYNVAESMRPDVGHGFD